MAMQKYWFGRRELGHGEGASQAHQAWGQLNLGAVSTAAIAGMVTVLGMAPQGLAQVYDIVPVVPEGAVPVPAAALPQVPTSGQQYLIYVRDTSDATLNQVRLIEPTAFRTTFQGQSVIQAGRFNMAGNAQQRVIDLAALGVSAQMAEVAAAVPSYTATAALPANVYASNGDLPPLPDTAFPTATVNPAVPVPALPPTVAQAPPPGPGVAQAPLPGPGSVEFGQQPNYGVPAAPTTTVEVITPPPAAPPTAQPVSAPYYVVIPTSAANLGNLSNQVIQLGTPPAQVQQRTEPRGPHVAVGPFINRDLANRWNDFYRDAGIPNARVFYQR